MLRRALALCVCLPLAGCVFGPGRVGPEGLSGYNTDLRSMARQEDFERALELTDEGADDAGDDLLRVLHRAALLRYAGYYEESNRLLQEAELEIDDRFTKSVSRAALSILTNDRALAYNPPRFEQMMLHYYGALNYLALDDPAEAAVEARRLSSLLVTAAEKQQDPRDVRFRRSLHYFAGTVFETAGEWNEAAVAYRNAWDGWNTSPGAPETEAAEAKPGVADAVVADAGAVVADAGAGREIAADPSLARGLAALTPSFIARDRAPAPDSGEVIIILETGFVAHRVERAAAVPIFRNDASSLKGGSDASRYNAGLCVAARTLGPRALVDVDDCARPSGKSLFVLTVAWPQMRRSSEPIRGARVTPRNIAVEWDQLEVDPSADRLAASTSTGLDPNLIAPTAEAVASDDSDPALPDAAARSVPTRLTMDLSAAAMSEYDARIGGIVAKSVARATGKYLVVQAVRKEVKKEDRTVGDIVGLVGNAAAVASERADTRSWHLLPGTIRIARLSLPSGVHSIELELDALRQTDPVRVELGDVHVRPGSVTILPVRSWP